MRDTQAVLGAEIIQISGSEFPVKQWFCDSRQVRSGDGFVAIPGTRSDGHQFIPQVLAQGARAVIFSDPAIVLPPGVWGIQVHDPARCWARLCREAVGCPDEKLTLLGVTGTNGKTTTAFLLYEIFNRSARPCGLISTVEVRYGDFHQVSEHTTPDSATYYRLLNEMQQHQMGAVALELSSHALAQGRAVGSRFRAAIFTNLTGDHLDYHRDMEHYYQAKKRFFTELLDRAGAAIINVDDAGGRRLALELSGQCRIITFAQHHEADWSLENLELSGSGSKFVLAHGAEKFPVTSHLVGEYNVYNLAGAILAARDCGLGISEIIAALRDPIAVPGRLEKFTSPQGAEFFIDYAHTDDALRNALGALRQLTAPGHKLGVVFGAGGDRDRTKRPRMGQAASDAADVVLVTSDNPRSENPETIIQEVVSGVLPGTEYEIIPDRRAAIRRAVELFQRGDQVLIAGKGHEDYQEIAGIKHHFSDREELLNAFQNLA